MSGNGQFQVSNGQILDPNGNTFTAHGIDVMFGGNLPSAATLQGDFPGINIVRLAVYNYESPDTLASYVNDLTSHGIVVEIENHQNNAGGAGGSIGTIFTGQTLQNESNWFASVASAFKSNPYVWFGTNNEPTETDSSGNRNPAALSQWQQASYNAIRNTGNTNPVMVEINGWGDPNSMAQGYTPSVYASMTNVIGDLHYYGWLTNYSTDQSTVSNFLQQSVQHTQQTLPTASGTMPIFIGEFGNSTTGTTLDANADQVINAVQSANYISGYAAWAWGAGNPYDGLSDGGSGLSALGRQVAAGIKASSASSVSLPPPAVTPAQPASANDTVVAAGSTAAITDAHGSNWTIQNGQVMKDGAAAGYSANVKEIAYVNGTVYQENASGLWWNWNGTSWAGGAGSATSPLPQVSPDQTVVKAGDAGNIVDASGNTWTLVNGVVQENGTAAGYSANVSEIAYAGGAVYQENAAGNWWQWNGTDWGTGAGTSTSPLIGTTPTPTPPVVTPPVVTPPPAPTPSPDQSVVLATDTTGSITDANGSNWTIQNGAVMQDGKAAGYSANVSEIAYAGGHIYQENASGLWWQWNGSNWGTGAGSATSPVTPVAPPVMPDTISVSANGSTQAATPGSSVNGDTFTLLSGSVVQATLSSTPQMVHFSGSSGAQVAGGSGVAIVSADAGTNSFTAGSGPMVVTGGIGADAYTFHAGAGFLGVQDFSAAKGDTLTIDSGLKAGMQAMNDGAGGTMLAFGGGSAIDLHNVTAAPTIHWS